MRVLVSRPDKIGDVVLSLHAVKQLKDCMPHLEVYMHVADYTRELVENIQFVDGVVTVGEDLAPYKFDVVVDLMAKARMAFQYSSSRLPIRIPLRIGNSARWFSPLYNRTGYIRRSHAMMNEAEYNWQLISLIDPSLTNTPLTHSVSAEDFKKIIPYTANTDLNTIMPGVTVSATGWPLERWATLATELSAQGPTVIILGPAEQKLKPHFDSLASTNSNISVECPQTFPELLGILQATKNFVGPSTGVTHLAGAMGCAGIALYPEQRSMHPSRWQPFHSKLHVLSLDRNPSPTDIVRAVNGSINESLDPLSRSPVSAFVICGNEENNIERCLESISWCDEIVVVDSESTDRTREIAAKYTDRVIIHPWEGHQKQKQFALEQCTHDWIVNIDSDEEVSAELRGHILKTLQTDYIERVPVNGFLVSRLVYFMNRWWNKGGWYPEYRMRFFRGSATTWGGVDPHEKALVEGPLDKLKGDIYHYTYKDMTHQLATLNAHSTNAANHLFAQGFYCRWYNLLLNPPFRFFKFYILKLGFREGFLGFLVAVTEAFYTFTKYAKLWELQRQRRRSEATPLVTSNRESNVVREAEADRSNKKAVNE